MGIPKRCNWQAAPDEGVSPGLDSALFWYCGEAISVPLVKRKPKLCLNHEPGPSFQSGAKLPHGIRSPQNPDDAGSPRSPVVSDSTESTFELPEIGGFSSIDSSEGRGRSMSCVSFVSSSEKSEGAKSSESESRSLLNSPVMHQCQSVGNAGNWIDSVSKGVLSESSLRHSPIGNSCARDIQIDSFDSGAAADDRSALDKNKLLEDSLVQRTGMREALFKPGTKMEDAINVQDPDPGPWGTNIASSRRRRPVSAQARLRPLQWQRNSKQLETPNAAASGTSESAFSRRLLSVAHHGFEGRLKESLTDVKTSPGTIKQRLGAGLQRCMQLRLTETLENGGLLYLGNKDDKAITALKSLDKKNNGFELRRSESDSTLSGRQKVGWPQCLQGQISRGLKNYKGLEVIGRGLKSMQGSRNFRSVRQNMECRTESCSALLLQSK